MLIWKAGSKVVCPVCRSYFQEERNQLHSLVLEKLSMSSPSCLTKVNFLRKVSGHRLYETGLSNDQTEVLKKHPASWSPILRLLRRGNRWQECHLFKLVIQLLWRHWSAQAPAVQPGPQRQGRWRPLVENVTGCWNEKDRRQAHHLP